MRSHGVRLRAKNETFVLVIDGSVQSCDIDAKYASILLSPLPCEERSLQKFLASIFLKECFVDDRSRQVVDHEVENRLDLHLGVTSVERESRVLERVSNQARNSRARQYLPSHHGPGSVVPGT